MSDEQKDRYINYLVNRLQELELDKKAMMLVLEDFLADQKEMKEEIAQMREKQNQIDSGFEMSNSKLKEEIKKRKKAEQKLERIKTQLELTQKKEVR